MIEHVRIAVLDAYDHVIAYLDNSAPKALHYYDDELHEYLKGTAYTFSFCAGAKHEDSQYLVVGNKLSFVRGDKEYYLNIMSARQDEYKIEVEAYSLSFELLNEEKEAYKAEKAMSLKEYLSIFDFEKVLTLGNNEVSDKSIKHEWTGTDTLLARVFSLCTVFDGEAEFVVHLNDNYSLNRIDLNVYQEHSDTVQGVGVKRTDIILRYGKNVTGITKTAEITGLYTAIRPTGKDGLTVADLEKKEYDADGNLEYYTSKGSRNILAPQARDRFPSNLMSGENDRYIAKIWSYETDNVNMLYGQALAELKKNCIPQVKYEVNGFFDTNIGDTVSIEDDQYIPTLYLEARVTEQVRSFTDRTRNKTTFDNFKEVQAQLDPSLIAKMNAIIEQNKTYTCMISTDNGTSFKNNEGSTTLTASVRDGVNDVTDNFSIVWKKDGADLATGKSITVNAADVDGKVLYRFEALDANGNVKGFYEVTITDVSDGKDGVDGTGYTVILSNESHTFPGSTSAAIESSVSTDVMAFKNDSRIPVTVTKIGDAKNLVKTTGSVTVDASADSITIDTGLDSVDGFLLYKANSSNNATHGWIYSDSFKGYLYYMPSGYTIYAYKSSAKVTVSNGMVTCTQHTSSYPVEAGTYNWIAFGSSKGYTDIVSCKTETIEVSKDADKLVFDTGFDTVYGAVIYESYYSGANTDKRTMGGIYGENVCSGIIRTGVVSGRTPNYEKNVGSNVYISVSGGIVTCNQMSNSYPIKAGSVYHCVAWGATAGEESSGDKTGIPGLTATVTDNGTISCAITFRATTELTTQSGVVPITMEVDGQTVTKNFSFALALTGANGKDGQPTGITEYAEEPAEKYVGMLWKNTGTTSGYIYGATYRWNGEAWDMYKFVAENIDVENLFAQTVEATGTITAENFRFRDKVFGVRKIDGEDMLLTLLSFVNAISGGNLLEVNPDYNFADMKFYYKDGSGSQKSFSLRSDLEELNNDITKMKKSGWNRLIREGFPGGSGSATWNLNWDEHKPKMFMLALGSCPASNATEKDYNRRLCTTIIPRENAIETIGVDKTNGAHQVYYNGTISGGISFISESQVKAYYSGEALIELMAWY